jgi:hypothetical protein
VIVATATLASAGTVDLCSSSDSGASASVFGPAITAIPVDALN